MKLIAELEKHQENTSDYYFNVVIVNGAKKAEYHLVIPDITFLSAFGGRVVKLAESATTK